MFEEVVRRAFTATSLQQSRAVIALPSGTFTIGPRDGSTADTVSRDSQYLLSMTIQRSHLFIHGLFTAIGLLLHPEPIHVLR